MRTYRYRAVDSRGKDRQGNVDATSIEAALQQLRAFGIFAVECSEVQREGDLPWWRRSIKFRRRVSQATLTNFTRELCTLVDAQLTIDESVRLIGKQDQMMRELCQYLDSGLRSGSSLSSLIEAYRYDFPPYYAPMVRAGELSGKLGNVLNELACLLERSRDVTNRIISALVYPIVLLAMSGVMMTVVFAVLIPSLLPLFEETGTAPPLLLRGFISARTVIESYWVLYLGFTAAILAVFYVCWQRKGVREVAHAAVLKLPVVGGIVLLAQISRITRVLATMLRGGVPLPDGLRISQTVVTNLRIAKTFAKAERGVREGAALSSVMAISPFPDRLIQLLRVGERAGRLEDMLQHSAAMMEQELQDRVERSLNLIEPLMTLVLGLSVGGLVMSVMDAILSVNELAI
jgi:general secretion pathway protein F